MSSTLLTEQEIQNYEETKSDFIDYARFEGDAKFRQDECDAFIDGSKYVPDYDYPKLDELAYDEKITQKKSKTYEAIMELEEAKKDPNYNPDELELYASLHESNLKKILLVEAARNLCNPIVMSDYDTNRQAYAEMNEAVYGELDIATFLGMLGTERQRIAAALRRLIMHEQEVHARRYFNGKNIGVKIIGTGTADFLEFEEGLGVILECAVGGNLDNPSFERARNRYITAGLALGADGHPRDAREVFEVLWRLVALHSSKDGVIDEESSKAAKEEAYKHIENAYRGTQFWKKGIIFTKLKVYYEGLAKNAEYFKQHIDGLDEAFDSDLFIGKYNHTDPSEKELILRVIRARQEQGESKE